MLRFGDEVGQPVDGNPVNYNKSAVFWELPQNLLRKQKQSGATVTKPPGVCVRVSVRTAGSAPLAGNRLPLRGARDTRNQATPEAETRAIFFPAVVRIPVTNC